MLYIGLFDRLQKEEVLKRSEKFLILSSVNTNTDAIDNAKEWQKLHRIIRFDQFKCFHENLIHSVDVVNEIYLKYGGFCFLDDYQEKDRFEFVKNHFSFMLKHKGEFQFDPFKNNLLWKEGSNLRIFDKVLIKCVLETGNIDLVYRRPLSNVLKTLNVSDIHNFTEKDILSNELTTQVK